MANSGRAGENITIGLSDSARDTVIGILNQLLADEFMLYSRARAFHWNVTGRHFKSDHALFEDDYEALDETIDAVAERARSLGGLADARLSRYVDDARIADIDSKALNGESMIASLLDGHETIIRHIRSDLAVVGEAGDEGTADFLIGLMEGHEKRAWMLRAHLQG